MGEMVGRTIENKRINGWPIHHQNRIKISNKY
jgi:hypothetical protein